MTGNLEMAGRPLSDDRAGEALVLAEDLPLQGNGTFTSVLVRNAARSMSAFERWRVYGVEGPALKELAIELLSRPGSACASERNWSNNSSIRSRLRNRPMSSRAADPVPCVSACIQHSQIFFAGLMDVREWSITRGTFLPFSQRCQGCKHGPGSALLP